MALRWSDKNELSPLDVFNTSTKKYIFDCNKCKHEFEIQLYSIRNNINCCPYCSSQRLCDNTKCVYCFNKSFASHEKSKDWCSENNITPRQVFKGSKKKYKFKCSTCKHTFEKRPNHINYDSYCPCIKNKTELLLLDFLKKFFDISLQGETASQLGPTEIEHQKKFKWCKNINMLPFDFFIKEYKLIIELDGPQHFKQISNWASCEETQKRDIYKMECANEKGISIIRIFQEDVWKNKNDWKTKIKSAINEIINQNNLNKINQCHDTINITIGNIYSQHSIYKSDLTY
jgi:very-short-patch-repair endonuclease